MKKILIPFLLFVTVSASAQYRALIEKDTASLVATKSNLTTLTTKADLTKVISDSAVLQTAIATKVAAPAAYEGLVATRGLISDNFNSGMTQLMSRSVHFATQTISSLKIAIPNWYLPDGTASVETATGGTATVTASVEYPSGTYTQIKFSGSATGTIASGNTLISDYTTVSIPQNAQFWVRIYWQNPSGVIYVSTLPTSGLGTGYNGGTTGVVDYTMSNGTIGSTNTYFPPLAIIGMTTKSSIIIIGDSRAWGLGDTNADLLGNFGNLTRQLGNNFGYTNLAVSGHTLQAWLSSHAQAASLFIYATHIIDAYQYNDLFTLNITSATAISQATSVQTIVKALGKKIINVTVGPRTTSTDSWATTANQTLYNSTQNTARIAFNTWIRNGSNGEDGYIDIAAFEESYINSGKWAVNGVANFFTSDGIHESTAGNYTLNYLTRAWIQFILK
jgi:hypothetical protein